MKPTIISNVRAEDGKISGRVYGEAAGELR
jgi:hypothetical protein